MSCMEELFFLIHFVCSKTAACVLKGIIRWNTDQLSEPKIKNTFHIYLFIYFIDCFTVVCIQFYCYCLPNNNM